MNYIESLVLVSNNEYEFQKKLIEIREELKNSKDVNTKIKRFIKSVNKYCENKISENYSDDNEIYILEADYFCMFTLDRLFKKTENKFEVKKQAILRLLGDETLPKDVLKDIDNQMTEEVFNIIDVCFPESTRYTVEKSDNPNRAAAFVKALRKNLISNFAYRIMNEITDKKPVIFVSEKGCEANITKLSILLRELNLDKLQNDAENALLNFCTSINVGLAQCAVKTLLEEILLESDVKCLCEKYGLSVSELDITIGKEVYVCINDLSHEYSELLKEVISLSKKRRTFADKVECWMHKN